MIVNNVLIDYEFIKKPFQIKKLKRFLRAYHQKSKISGLTSIYSVLLEDKSTKLLLIKLLLLTTEHSSSITAKNFIFKNISPLSFVLTKVLYKNYIKKYIAILLLQ